MGGWYGTLFLATVAGTLWVGLVRMVWRGLESGGRMEAPGPVWFVLLSGRDGCKEPLRAPDEAGSDAAGGRETAA